MVRHRRAQLGFALIALLTLLAVVSARAAENDGLATDFGGFGVGGTVDDAPLAINDLALQPDGKVVAVGVQNTTFAVARYLAHGVLDPSFGKQGLVITPISDTQQRAEATGVAVQPDGMIVVVG
ncbi:MAG: hypothetical protein H7Z42_09645, partial [Roseiflexaceae bacterium]|nr:hypothetical protein [Roseiflexaceae bacterium]